MTDASGERPPDQIKATLFAIVPEWVLDESADVVKLYAILDRYAGKDRRLWPGQAELAERMKCSERHVRRTLTRLREIRALEMVKRRYNGTTIYVLRKDDPGLPCPERPDQGVLTDRTPQSGLTGHHSPPNESHSSRAIERESVVKVFEAWKASTKKTERTVLDARRTKVITDALKLYPMGDVLDAVHGWEHSPFHRGENPEGRIHNDLSLLLRDAKKIEQFRDYTRFATATKVAAEEAVAKLPANLRTYDSPEEFAAWQASKR